MLYLKVMIDMLWIEDPTFSLLNQKDRYRFQVFNGILRPLRSNLFRHFDVLCYFILIFWRLLLLLLFGSRGLKYFSFCCVVSGILHFMNFSDHLSLIMYKCAHILRFSQYRALFWSGYKCIWVMYILFQTERYIIEISLGYDHDDVDVWRVFN